MRICKVICKKVLWTYGDVRINTWTRPELEDWNCYFTSNATYSRNQHYRCNMRSAHKWHIKADTEAEQPPGCSLQLFWGRCTLVEVMNVCHCVKQPFCFFCCCEGSEFWCPVATQQPTPSPPYTSSGKIDWLFFHHLCWGRAHDTC